MRRDFSESTAPAPLLCTHPLLVPFAPLTWLQAVIEEIFENQRLQPFRGWGHTWPGHFLPTDKVSASWRGAAGAAPHPLQGRPGFSREDWTVLGPLAQDFP